MADNRPKLIKSDTRQWSSGAVRLSLIGIPNHPEKNYIVMEKVFFGRSKHEPQKFLLRNRDWQNLKTLVEGEARESWSKQVGWVSGESEADDSLAEVIAAKPELLNVILASENLGNFSESSLESLDALAARIVEIKHESIDLILKRIAESRSDDIKKFSHLLQDLRLSQVGLLSSLTYQKIRVLDILEQITTDAESHERKVHELFDRYPWLLGPGYEILQSDKSLADYLEKNAADDPELRKRPDLIVRRVPLADEVVLIELKRPGIKLSAKHIGQVLEYKALIMNNQPNLRSIKCFLFGYEKSSSFTPSADVEIKTFSELVKSLRDQFSSYQQILDSDESSFTLGDEDTLR